jgi:hypothetical protein
MNRDLVIPLLSRGWSSTKWDHAKLDTWTFAEVGEKRRIAAWVRWEEGWDAYYTQGWYCLELTGDRVSWSVLYEAGKTALGAVQEWVCQLE